MTKRTTTLVATIAACSAAAAVAIGSGALPAAAAPHGHTLHYTTTFVSYTPNDLAPKGDSAGDRSTDLFALHAHGKTVGTFAQDCVLVVPGEKHPLALCSGTFAIGGSTIVVSDEPNGSSVVHGAVIGGTGRFAGATGTLSVKTGETATVTIHLR